jgi:hypothetical protein
MYIGVVPVGDMLVALTYRRTGRCQQGARSRRKGLSTRKFSLRTSLLFWEQRMRRKPINAHLHSYRAITSYSLLSGASTMKSCKNVLFRYVFLSISLSNYNNFFQHLIFLLLSYRRIVLSELVAVSLNK